MSDETRALLDAIVPGFAGESGDWQRVLLDAGLHDRAAAPPRRRSFDRRRGARRLALAVTVVLAIAAPLAIAARTTHLLDFAFGRTPSKAVQRQLILMLPRSDGLKGPRLPATQADLIRSSVREVGELRTSSGAVARMYAGDLRTGGLCFYASGGPFNGGSCRFRALRRTDVLIAASGSWGSPKRGTFGNRVTWFGRVTSTRATSLLMHFKDGGAAVIPLRHRWFMYEVPPAHEMPGHEPASVSALDANGATVGTLADPFALRQLNTPRLERPLPASERVLATVPLGWRGAVLRLETAKGDRGTQCMRAVNTGDLVQTRSWTCRSIESVTFVSRTKPPVIPLARVELRQRTHSDGKPGGYVYVRGWVQPRVASLELRFQDSSVAPLTLRQGLFIDVIAPDRWARGKRPSYVVGRDAGGRVVYRHFLYPNRACSYPVRERGCESFFMGSG